MGHRRRWCLVAFVAPDGTTLLSAALAGAEAPDLGAVDAVARMALAARRAGATLRVSAVTPALEELLRLAALPVELEGEGAERA